MPKTTNPLESRSGMSTNIIMTVTVVVVAVVVIGGVLLFNSKGGEDGTGGNAVPAQVLRKPDSHVLLDAPQTPVTVVEFVDYQCPICFQYHVKVYSELKKKYQGKIDFVVRNYPLDAHPLARSAAKSAEAAGLQGKYADMHEALYTNWEQWAVAPDGQNLSTDVPKAEAQFEQYAQQIGLDMAKYKADLNSPQVQQHLKTEADDGDKAGITGTPTMFINGHKFESTGAKTFDDLNKKLQEQIDAEMNR